MSERTVDNSYTVRSEPKKTVAHQGVKTWYGACIDTGAPQQLWTQQMKLRWLELGSITALVTCALAAPAAAYPVLCEDAQKNHMYVDSAYVSSCVDASVGNVNGNPQTDDFLLKNPSLPYVGIGDATFTQSGSTGTFSLMSSLWNTWDSLALGFKFGTGGKPDQWFVYLLNSDVSWGTWRFVNLFNRGGGLSHVQIYGVKPAQVPEPATLGLLGLGILGFAFARHRRPG